MKLPRRLIFLLVSATACCSALAETSWERYLALPNPIHARAVTSATYGQAPELGSESERLEFDLQLLATQASAGDIEALRLVLRLSATQDGSTLEELGSIMGGTVRSRPALFLQAQSELPDAAKCFGVASVDPSFVDRTEARQYELRLRKAALESVSDFPELRKRCVAELAGS
jgi:hypothetical protein